MTTPLALASPAALGFDAPRLARIDRFLAERYVEPGLLPCALLLVARRGVLVHRSVLGHASLERGQRLEEDTIFRIYSMTKPVTSVALMMLVEEGRIALDDRSRSGFRRGASSRSIARASRAPSPPRRPRSRCACSTSCATPPA